MKVTIDIDCKPEGARAFMGLPDVSAAHQAVVEEWQKQAMAAMSSMDPRSLFKAWIPDGTDGWDQFQRALWETMPNPCGTPKS